MLGKTPLASADPGRRENPRLAVAQTLSFVAEVDAGSLQFCDNNCCMHRPNAIRAWSLFEVLVVLAVLGMLLIGYALMFARTASAARLAQELTRVVAGVRWAAVQDGAPRTVAAAEVGNRLVVVRGEYACSHSPTSTVIWDWPARATTRLPPMGLAFAPDGRPRRCDGSGVGNTTILIEGPRGDRAAVIIASLGRVRWERR